MNSARLIIEQFNGVFANSSELRADCLSDISYRGLCLPDESLAQFFHASPFTTAGIFMFAELVDMKVNGDIAEMEFLIEDIDGELSEDDSELRFTLCGPVHLLDIEGE